MRGPLVYTFAFLVTETGDTVDGLAGFDVNFQSVGLIGLGALAIWLILTGRLLPKNVVDSLLRAKDKVIETQAQTIEAQAGTQEATEKLLKTLNEKAGEKAVHSDGT